MSECRVALLAGGKSGEREVSLASAEGAREALEEAGYTVTQLDPADKEDLKRLIDGPFDVAFLCLHGKYGEDGTVQGLLETIGLPYICLLYTSEKRSKPGKIPQVETLIWRAPISRPFLWLRMRNAAMVLS